MVRRKYERTYIQAWREYRGLSLRRLADRISDVNGDPLVTYASLSRIEKGLQPYSQPILEALAEALGTDPPSLLMRDPTDKDAIWSIWDRLSPTERRQASAVIEALKKTGT